MELPNGGMGVGDETSGMERSGKPCCTLGSLSCSQTVCEVTRRVGSKAWV